MTVVNSIEWLFEKAESLVASGDPEAVDYLRRLLDASDAIEHQRFAHHHLGVMLFRAAEIDQAREHFHAAASLSPDDPGIPYALGHCDAAQGDWWSSLHHFVHAIYLGRQHPEEIEFMRAAAVGCRRVGLNDVAHRILIGALERSPNHPYVLESLGRLYEAEERWIDAIRVRDALIEVLKGNDPRNRPKQLSPAVESTPIRPERVHERVRTINDRLRQGFSLVDESTEREIPDFVISRTAYPAGLHTVIASLSRRDNPDELTETALGIWARAAHDRFDVHLSTGTLSAAVHWLAERLLWRPPTSGEDLERLYAVDAEQIRAAVRLLASRFDLELIPVEGASMLGRELDHFKKVAQAILLDVGLDELEPTKMLL